MFYNLTKSAFPYKILLFIKKIFKGDYIDIYFGLILALKVEGIDDYT